ncbi:MAG: type I secretion system permease/ATPase [Rhizobiaceae bacterium]|nr:type I secretion system permease/ATPase [Hyphomicrobiales bacterium]NRB32048.1 type I secretion system permease/ATPase [Rhizobiaceae bacterium]
MQRLPLKWIAIFSVATNLLMIVPPLHMLQVYDRVLTSNSMETLIYLTLIALAAMVLYGIAEAVRGKLAQRAAAQYTVSLSEPLFKRLSSSTVDGARGSSQVLRDFNSVRGFIASRALTGLFDLPFVPFFILLMFLLHWVLGVMTLVGTFALVGIAWLNKVSTAKDTDESKQSDMEALTFAQTVFMRAEDIRAMGLLPSVMERWGQKMATSLQKGDVAAGQTSTFYGISKSVRKMLQILIMACGAYLVLKGDVSGGVIFAASMISGRALAPVEQVIGGWDRITHARTANANLKAYLADAEMPHDLVQLPQPIGHVSVEGLSYSPSQIPNAKPVLDEVSFDLPPGKILAVIGPSGAGKSTVAKALVGAITPDSGQIMLDGAQRSQYPEDQWGEAVGYVSQEITLFPATLAENIARLELNPDSEKVVAAAQAAGVHELITSLPDGYSTEIGPGKLVLSGGQKQRIALARALYSDPKVLVLDEPNAHLDAQGEVSLMNAMKRARNDGRTIIVVTQRRTVLQVADYVMTIRDGRVSDFSSAAHHKAKPANAQTRPAPNAPVQEPQPQSPPQRVQVEAPPIAADGAMTEQMPGGAQL